MPGRHKGICGMILMPAVFDIDGNQMDMWCIADYLAKPFRASVFETNGSVSACNFGGFYEEYRSYFGPGLVKRGKVYVIETLANDKHVFRMDSSQIRIPPFEPLYGQGSVALIYDGDDRNIIEMLEIDGYEIVDFSEGGMDVWRSAQSQRKRNREKFRFSIPEAFF